MVGGKITVYNIVMQKKKVEGGEIEVVAKQVRFSPVEDKETKEIRFLPLGFPMVKILLEKHGEVFELTLSETTKGWRKLYDQGYDIGVYAIRAPSKMVPEYERNAGTNSICKDRRGNPIIDYLKPPKEVKGEKRKFNDEFELRTHLEQNNGKAWTDFIIDAIVTCFEQATEAMAGK